MSSMRPPAWYKSPDDSQQTTPLRSGGTAGPGRGQGEEPGGIDAIGVQIDRLKPLLRGMRRHWTTGLIGLFGVGALVAIFVLRYQHKYRSETVIYHQQAMSSERVTGTAPGMADPNLLRELLLRHGRLEGLIEELGLFKSTVDQVGKVAAVEEMKKRINFEPMGRSTFRIGYVGETAEQAQLVASRLAASLIDDDMKRRQAQADKAASFLEAEVKRTSEELRKKESALERFIAANPAFAATAPPSPATRRRPNPTTVAPAPGPAPGPRPAPVRRRRAAPGPAAPAPPTTPSPRPRVPKAPDPKLVNERNEALSELTRASRQLSQLQSRYTDKHPEVVSAKSRVAAAEARVSKANAALQQDSSDDFYDTLDEPAPAPAPPPTAVAPPPAPRPIPVPARPRPAPSKAEPDPEPEPKPKTNSQSDPEQVAALETEWARLTRSVVEAREREERLAQESYRARIANRSQVAGHNARVVVLDEAFLPAGPIRSRSFFLKLGIPVALLAAIALVLLHAILDDRVYEASDLVHGGYEPVLSVVPAAGGKKKS